MGKFNWINGQSGGTPLSAENLNQMQDSLLELVFPVGSTYITQTNVNPNIILGFGTWERLKGKVCLGLDEDDSELNAIGKTGGEKKHTQTIAEMPPHNHSLTNNTLVNRNAPGSNGSQGSTTVHGATIECLNAGGGQPFNIMQPYEIVGYMWIRRS